MRVTRARTGRQAGGTGDRTERGSEHGEDIARTGVPPPGRRPGRPAEGGPTGGEVPADGGGEAPMHTHTSLRVTDPDPEALRRLRPSGVRRRDDDLGGASSDRNDREDGPGNGDRNDCGRG